ncbi:hypothetical protein E2C01_020746 [Portunus trituberculatus]|uniref:Uncharacterized protein n=1 Tax=Portunus trituberculatus TaxID=210409 RepID=A0A5B7E0P9_PORTR|nr:hypothetical protein [Portunus trituberculatus]
MRLKEIMSKSCNSLFPIHFPPPLSSLLPPPLALPPPVPSVTLVEAMLAREVCVTGDPRGSPCGRQGTTKFEAPNVHLVVHGHSPTKSEFRQDEICQVQGLTHSTRVLKAQSLTNAVGSDRSFTMCGTKRVGDDEGEENVEELRERLRQMKALVNERTHSKKSGIDEGFLSVVFACILVVIAGVTLYAFVVLYTAVHRRWTENPDTD